MLARRPHPEDATNGAPHGAQPPDELAELGALVSEQFTRALIEGPDAARYEEAMVLVAVDLARRLRARGDPPERALVAIKRVLCADEGVLERAGSAVPSLVQRTHLVRDLTDRVVRECIVAYYGAPGTD